MSQLAFSLLILLRNFFVFLYKANYFCTDPPQWHLAPTGTRLDNRLVLSRAFSVNTSASLLFSSLLFSYHQRDTVHGELTRRALECFTFFVQERREIRTKKRGVVCFQRDANYASKERHSMLPKICKVCLQRDAKYASKERHSMLPKRGAVCL